MTCCCCLSVIDLPSLHYRWYVTNSSVAHIDTAMGVAHALSLGTTDIVVEDTRLSGHEQRSTMHVVIPGKLCLYLVPVTNGSIPVEGVASITSSEVWYVFPGQEYMINIKVLTEGPDVNEILITEVGDDFFFSSEAYVYFSFRLYVSTICNFRAVCLWRTWVISRISTCILVCIM